MRLTPQKAAVQAHFDRLAPDMEQWRRRSWYYHQELRRLCRFVIPPGATVLEVGCGTGDLLAAVEPSAGVGVDLSPRMIAQARRRFPELEWRVGDGESLDLDRRFDYIIMSDLLGHLEDIWAAFQCLGRHSRPDTRVIITNYNYLWEPFLKLAELAGQRIPLRMQNWLPLGDIQNLLHLADFEVVRRDYRFLVPKHIPLVAEWVNRVVATLPGIRRLGLIQCIVARPRPRSGPGSGPAMSCSIVVPCRNEVGNIEAAVARIPEIGSQTEIIFVDGASTDGTQEKIATEIERHRGKRDIRL